MQSGTQILYTQSVTLLYFAMQIQTIFLLTHAFHSHYKSFTVHRRSTREEGRRRLREKNRLERVRRGDVPCDMNHGIDSFLSQQPVALPVSQQILVRREDALFCPIIIDSIRKMKYLKVHCVVSSVGRRV